MKRWLVIGLFVFLMVVMVGGVSAIEKFEYGTLVGENGTFDGQNVINGLINEKINGLWTPLGYIDINISNMNFINNIKINNKDFHQISGTFNFREGLFNPPQKNYKGYVTGTKIVLKGNSTDLHSFNIFAIGYDEITQERIEGTIEFYGYNGSGYTNSKLWELRFKGFKSNNSAKISNLETDVSTLQSWQQTIDDWKLTIDDTITNIWIAITGLVTTTDDHEVRIETLENQTGYTPNQTFPDYLNYLSSTDRKKIVCGYAEDNRLTEITDLGYDCTLTYRTYRSGRERVSCRCRRL